MGDLEGSARVILPDWFDERAEFETPLRGYLLIEVETPENLRYQLFFYDPERLHQDLDSYCSLGEPFVAEPGLVVIPQLSVPAIDRAVELLYRRGFFNRLKPLEPGERASWGS